MNEKQLTQGTNLKFSQDTYLPAWIDAFLVDRKATNVAKGTLRFYTQKLRLFADYCESQAITQVTEITPDTLRQCLLWLETTGHNPGGIHAVYRTIKVFLRWWEQEIEPDGWKNPIRKVKAPRVPQEPLQPVGMDEIRRILEQCPRDFTGERDRAIFLTLYDTGMRASELLAVDLVDLDAVTGCITVRQGKGRKPRSVYIGQKTRKAIRAYLKYHGRQHPALFLTDDGERLKYDGLRAIVTRRARLAGLTRPPSLHAFRRAFALEMLRAGTDVFTLQKLMGHADLQVLRRYLAQSDQDLKAAHDKGSPGDKT